MGRIIPMRLIALNNSTKVTRSSHEIEATRLALTDLPASPCIVAALLCRPP
jgi:hypothetical protein